jgi:uncharacterized protein (TIGR00296 family)
MVVTPEHCAYCFDVLHEHFDKSATVVVPALTKDKYPLFVTWKKRDNNDDEKEYQLRGCIGTFSAQRLQTGLRDYALTSALKDSRFSPMRHHELPYLQCTVSLLTDFEPASAWDDWKIGVHGITIELAVGDSSYSATFLPEVAEEQGWSHKQCVDALIRKAGYRGPVDSALRSRLVVTRYQSSKCDLTYEEYLQMRKTAAAAAAPMTN